MPDILPIEYKSLKDSKLSCSCGHTAAYAIKRHGNLIKAEYFPVCSSCFGLLRWSAGGKIKETNSIISVYKK